MDPGIVRRTNQIESNGEDADLGHFNDPYAGISSKIEFDSEAGKRSFYGLQTRTIIWESDLL